MRKVRGEMRRALLEIVITCVRVAMLLVQLRQEKIHHQIYVTQTRDEEDAL
jgi:hypothetical protein